MDHLKFDKIVKDLFRETFPDVLPKTEPVTPTTPIQNNNRLQSTADFLDTILDRPSNECVKNTEISENLETIKKKKKNLQPSDEIKLNDSDMDIFYENTNTTDETIQSNTERVLLQKPLSIFTPMLKGLYFFILQGNLTKKKNLIFFFLKFNGID